MATGRVQWRRFAFFDRDVISENIKAKNVDSSITCAVAEGGTLVFGDAMGHIYIADRDLELGEVKHKVFRGEVKGVSYLLDAQHKRQFIVTAGNDSRPRTAADGTVIPNLNASYVVKIFNVADMSRPMNAFLAATGPENAHAVLTAFAVTPDGTQIALGFSNRTILLYSGPFLKEGAMLRQVPPEILFPPRNTLLPVTGLHFCELNNGGGSGGGGKGPSSSSFSSSSSSQPEAGGNGNNSNRTADKLRRTRLFAVLDIDAAVAAAADANSAPDYFSEAGNDEEVRQLYPGVFGNPKTKNMHGLNDDGSPLSASDVIDLAEGGVFVFDTTVSVSYRGGTAMVLAPPGGRRAVTVLDDRGGGLHCSSLMKASSELLVGRAEGVFSYSVDDRGAAAGFEGDKQCIATVGSYVLVASSDLKSKRTGITAYDLRHKFIAMSSQLPGEERIRSVINDGGTCYILTSSHSLIRFREKDTATKLDLLVKKSLYPLAISLAAEERSSVSDIMRLYRQHADHCYAREEYESAALQYSYTIGYVPSSYVIRKFLEPTLVAHLVFYLERLQEKGLATNDHASVLLLAYAKTGDRDALKRFIYSCSNEPATTQYGAAGQLSRTAAVPMREAPAWGGGSKSVTTRVGESNAAAATGSSSNGSSSSGGGGKKTSLAAAQEEAQAAEEALKASYAELGGFIDFQVEPCIETLRSNNYLDLALLLARTCDKHTSVVGLMLERVKAADSGSGGSGGDNIVGDSPSSELLRTLSEMALALPTDQLVEIAAVHGSALLALDADVITALFIKMCTGELDALRSASSSSSSSSDSNSNSSSTAYYDNNDIERIVSVFGGGNHTGSLLTFMEAVLDHRKTDQRSGRHFSQRLSETLLELYLAEYSRRKTDFEASYSSHVPPQDADYPRRWPDKTRALQGKLQEEERRVMGALDGSHTDKYDAAHALLLAHNHGCEVAQRFLLERFESADLLLRKYMEAEDEKGIFRVLRREGKKDPDLYVQVLTYFVQQSLNVGGSKSGGAADDTKGDNDDDDDDDEDDDEEGRWDAVAQVLSLVESESRIPHMKILHVLARNPELPLSVARRFITRHIVQAREETEELESATVATAATIHDLKQASCDKKKKRKKSKMQKQGNEPKLGAVGVIDGHDEDIDDFAEDDAARMRAGSGSLSGPGLGRDSDEDEEGDGDDDDDEEEDDSFGGSSMLSQRDRSILHETESAIENEKWDRIKKLSLNRANEHEAFYAELEASEDGFGTVASAFGKTIMGGAV